MNDTDSITLQNLLDTNLTIFTYVTNDTEPGAIILNTTANPNLDTIFDNNSLFTMHDTKKKIIKLRDILENGVVCFGSIDLMETIKIIYPDKRLSDDKPKIIGTYIHGSRKSLIAGPLRTEFDYDPESDPESDNEIVDIVGFDNNDTDNKTDIDLKWLYE